MTAIRAAQFLTWLSLPVTLPWLLTAYPGGPPIRRTAAPGDRTCLDASCHVGVRLPDSASVRLDTGANFTYTPGAPRQRWILTVDDSLARAFGFQMSARTASDPAGGVAGQLHEADATTQVVCDNQILAGSRGCLPATLVQFVQHIEPRERGSFSIDWTPPAENVGDVLAYVAANASVTGQRNSRIHLKSFVIRPVLRDIVVNAATQRGEISSGAWASVYGSELADSKRSWRPDDFRNGILPLTLDGVSVRVNGRAAAISFISPERIDFQAPDDSAIGEVPVEVWNAGRLAAKFQVRRGGLTPGLFVAEKSGRHYVAAATRPGQIVAIYGTGFGPADPPVPAGQAFNGVARTLALVRVRIGGREAEVQFSGLISAGLYQINLLVPELPAGDYLIEADLDGQATQSHVYLAIE